MAKVQAFEVAPVTSTPKTETLIQFILDETGSMNSCLDSTISSFNEYIDSQKSVDENGVPCFINLTKFSETHGSLYRSPSVWTERTTVDKVRHVQTRCPLWDMMHLTKNTFTPSGGTNLYDAIGATIQKLDSQIRTDQNVLVVIITDGEENCSKEYTLDAIRSMIQERTAKGWTFVYLGANQDAWKVGAGFGLSKGQTMAYSTADMKGTMATLSAATTSYRSARGLNASVGTDFGFFTGEEDK